MLYEVSFVLAVTHPEAGPLRAPAGLLPYVQGSDHGGPSASRAARALGTGPQGPRMARNSAWHGPDIAQARGGLDRRIRKRPQIQSNQSKV